MANHRRFAGFELTHLLLLVTTIELAFNRLAVRELRPVGEESPPLWHQLLDHFGLFCQYFASTLAIGLIGRHLWRLRRRRDLYWSVPRWGLVIAGTLFLATATFTIVTNPGEHGSFLFESAFVLVLLFLGLGQTSRGGDRAAKIGVLLLIVPLAIPFYGPLWLWLGPSGQVAEAALVDLPERARLLGQWAMVIAALVTPYCFAPRPFLNAAARLGPLVVACFVGAVGVVILRQHYEVGMSLAHHGLGIDIGPGAPQGFLALYLLALCTITWTLASCLGADAVARRDIGVGLGLLVVGGYGFAWPLQYLVSLAGLMTIGESAARVAREERAGAAGGPGFQVPPIAGPAWARYAGAVFDALAAEAKKTDAGTGVTSFGLPTDAHSDYTTTGFRLMHHGLRILVAIEQREGAITSVDIQCGEEPPTGPDGGIEEPQWTMYALPERIQGLDAHPEPPATSAKVARIADVPFAERFRVRDAGGYTERLLDEGLRARATALIDGWVAFWDGYGLHYRVHPGQGAPLDHPIPITELAFRGTAATPSAERLVTLVSMLAGVAHRGLHQPDDAGVPADADE